MHAYTEIADLSKVILEESWVLSIELSSGSAEFVCDFVLAPDHPLYTEPRSGEIYCYRLGQLRFDGVVDVRWRGQGAPAARDASGSSDLGHFDIFRWSESAFEISGDFGLLDVTARQLAIVFGDTSSTPR